MEWFIENWYMAIGLAAILIATGFSACSFLKLPRPDQIAKIKEWLLWACIEAEKELGSGTGKVKLRYVYDMFVQKFPAVDKMISFETFSSWVDEAVIEMKKLLETNTAVERIIDKKDVDVSNFVFNVDSKNATVEDIKSIIK